MTDELNNEMNNDIGYTRNYLGKIKGKFSIEYIKDKLKKLSSLRVLVIGDTIIDHYLFVEPKGRAIKDPILSVEYKSREIYAGGVLAVANHISDYIGEVKLVTLIGDENPLKHRIIAGT